MVVRGLSEQAFDAVCGFALGREEGGIDNRGLVAVLCVSRWRLLWLCFVCLCLDPGAFMPSSVAKGKGQDHDMLSGAMAQHGAWSQRWFMGTAKVNTAGSEETVRATSVAVPALCCC